MDSVGTARSVDSRRSWPRRGRWAAVAVMLCAAVALAACSAPGATAPRAQDAPWTEIEQQAEGHTVSLWMYGGDEQGNTYVDDHLIPAARAAGITLRRVPVASTTDAVNRVLSERQAGITDGDVDLVWVNGADFATGAQAGAWLCGWTADLPNMRYVDPDDPLLSHDFGTPVDGCEAPWHKAQFTLVYNAATVADPPSTLEGVLEWAQAHPGRFTYPAPPDFTGSVFVREVLASVSGGAQNVPLQFSRQDYDRLTPALFDRLRELAPSLWRKGRTYPQTSSELDDLFAGGQVDMTMTYGPAALTELVDDGTYPASTKVLPLAEGTVGNASFLAIPSTSGESAAARVVANIALSPAQQLASARPGGWAQFPVLAPARLQPAARHAFDALPSSTVVPPYAALSKNAHAELSAQWVTALDEGWRRHVLAGR